MRKIENMFAERISLSQKTNSTSFNRKNKNCA